MMRVLIACEFSGTVREAFRRQGHDAWSCDLLPAEDNSPNHLRVNVLNIIEAIGSSGFIYDSAYGTPQYDPPLEWDLMIAHPPCTYLCNSGVKHLYLNGRRENGPDPVRWAEMNKAAGFFKALLDAPIPRICIENPVMHGYGREALGWKYEQIIQPWQFGHGEIKATCVWLKGLPKLVPTKVVEGRTPRVHHASPGVDRWKERSRTLQGIADAMAEQWGRE